MRLEGQRRSYSLYNTSTLRNTELHARRVFKRLCLRRLKSTRIQQLSTDSSGLSSGADILISLIGLGRHGLS